MDVGCGFWGGAGPSAGLLLGLLVNRLEPFELFDIAAPIGMGLFGEFPVGAFDFVETGRRGQPEGGESRRGTDAGAESAEPARGPEFAIGEVRRGCGIVDRRPKERGQDALKSSITSMNREICRP